jgi:hypothetical protein
MALPRRIFIALGDPSDVSPVAAHDVQLQKLREEKSKREKAEKQAKELEKFIYERQKWNEQVLGAATLFVLTAAAFAFAIWLCLHWRPQPPERPPETPLVIRVPLPVPVPQLHHDCKGGCGPHYDSEYEGFECWRHRSMRGLCFD